MKRTALLIPALLLIAGCAGAPAPPSGSWVGSREVARAFEAGEVFSGHQYDYMGSRAVPDGVIAIDPRFRLKEGNIWAAVDADESTLAEWHSWWRAVASHHCMYLGGLILTPAGERAGYWYSPFLLNRVEMTEDGELVVHLPHSPTGVTRCEGDGGNEDREFLWGR